MEFYVEGLRSRTLKSLTPKLGKYLFSVCTVCDYFEALWSFLHPFPPFSPPKICLRPLYYSYFVSYVLLRYFLSFCVGVVYFPPLHLLVHCTFYSVRLSLQA